MLDALSEKTGLNRTDWIRQAIRRAYAEAFGDVPPKPRPKRK